jgi:group I intron endonuclease
MLHKTIPKNSSGIYKIVNLTNNKIYIGSSKNLYNRYSTHKCKLKYNNHVNKHLQSSYNKYGKDNFIFEVLETCTKDKLIEREQYYIDTLKPNYNKCLTAIPCLGLSPKKETRDKISQTLKEKNKNLKELNLPTLNPKNEHTWIKVRCYDMQGNKIKDFESITQASTWLNGTRKLTEYINHICKNIKNRKSILNTQWRFVANNLEKIDPIISRHAIIFYNENEKLFFNNVPEAQEYFKIKGLHKAVKNGFWKNYLICRAQNKQGELLETPTLERQKEDNQQPSLDSNIFEGSTTNNRVQTDNAEDSNVDTSALHSVTLYNFTLINGELVKIY